MPWKKEFKEEIEETINHNWEGVLYAKNENNGEYINVNECVENLVEEEIDQAREEERERIFKEIQKKAIRENLITITQLAEILVIINKQKDN